MSIACECFAKGSLNWFRLNNLFAFGSRLHGHQARQKAEASTMIKMMLRCSIYKDATRFFVFYRMRFDLPLQADIRK